MTVDDLRNLLWLIANIALPLCKLMNGNLTTEKKLKCTMY